MVHEQIKRIDKKWIHVLIIINADFHALRSAIIAQSWIHGSTGEKEVIVWSINT